MLGMGLVTGPAVSGLRLREGADRALNRSR
jgi:hypothetical protein